MTPYYADDWLTVYLGDCRAVLAELPADSVHCVITSPPYYGLRDYGTAGQIGLEPTPEQYVAELVAVFREVRRVLRPDGTVWLNLGDSYAGGGAGPTSEASTLRGNGHVGGGPKAKQQGSTVKPLGGLKPKDRMMIPARVALALQADGWWLRDEIVWAKPNPMPSSVTDRTTPAHEMVYLLTKRARYWYDADAVREPVSEASDFGKPRPIEAMPSSFGHHRSRLGNGSVGDAVGRNKRSVWTIATQPYPEAHFATFPEALVEPMILAGCPERTCAECGAPWLREIMVETVKKDRPSGRNWLATSEGSVLGRETEPNSGLSRDSYQRPSTVGWRRSCRTECCATWGAAAPVPGTVLDPFAGSGTVGLVAQRHSRRAVLIDLSAEYMNQLMRRNQDMPLGLETA